jgi:hypothetical protein
MHSRTIHDASCWCRLQVGREALSLMVPCADMANHGMQPNAAYRLEPDSQTFTITTTEVRQ